MMLFSAAGGGGGEQKFVWELPVAEAYLSLQTYSIPLMLKHIYPQGTGAVAAEQLWDTLLCKPCAANALR